MSSQLKAPLPARPSSGIPSISTARTQAWCRFAQVIHRLMHTQPVSSPLTGLAASGRSARRACVTRPGRRRQGPGVDEIAQEDTDASAALQERQPVYRRLPADHARPDPVRTASRGPRAPGRSLSGLRYHSHDLERDALAHRPPGSAAAQRPGPHPVMTADQSRWRIPAVARRAVAVLAKPFRPGRIRQGPSMYEMEGPCPASPHRLASCLAVPTPRAARRGQVPVRGDRSPGSSHVPGVAPRWCPFPNGENISTA